MAPVSMGAFIRASLLRKGPVDSDTAGPMLVSVTGGDLCALCHCTSTTVLGWWGI